jgi:3-hydroxybutyryl-CoA dehydratase
VSRVARSYFEDVVPGVSFETPAITLTEAHVTQFLGLTTDWPDHAADGPAVPDLLSLCLSSGLGWRIPAPPLAVLAFMGLDWRFLQPLHIGDTIRSRSVTVGKRSIREGGVVVEARDILNQRDEVAQSGRLTLLIAKRPTGVP